MARGPPPGVLPARRRHRRRAAHVRTIACQRRRPVAGEEGIRLERVRRDYLLHRDGAVAVPPIATHVVAAPPDKSPDRIAGMFDAIAPRYDVLNHLLSAGIDRRWRTAAIRSLKLTGRETLLDICCGTADIALQARRPGRRGGLGRSGGLGRRGGPSGPPAARVAGVDF